jgi:hypothetical protein
MFATKDRTDLAGISKTACPTACNIERCVISAGRPLCFHPCGSGVPFNFKNDPEIQKIYADACKILDVRNKHEIQP